MLSMPAEYSKIDADMNEMTSKAYLTYFSNNFLQNVSALIEDEEVACVSFDFFDTLVFRRVPTPTNVFYLVGSELVQRGLIARSCTPDLFHDLRIEAERRARERRRGGSTEVTLTQIYQELPRWLIEPKSLVKVMSVELDIERAVINIYRPSIDLLRKAKDLDKKVLIVSDTYLSSEFVADLLASKASVSDVTVYTSCEHNAGKYDNIFEIVCKNEKLRPSQILHLGDNYACDVERPAKLGLRTQLLPNGTSQFWTVFEREVELKGERFGLLDRTTGDSGLTSMRSKVVQHFNKNKQDPYVEYGSYILGPILMGFARWTKDVARELGLAGALCVMREGYLIEQLLKREAGAQVPVSLVSLSRRVLLQAGIYDVTQESLRQLFVGRERATLREFLALIFLTPIDLPEYVALTERPLNDSERAQIVERIVHDRRLVESIKSRASALRRNLIAHLLEKLPFKPPENSKKKMRCGLIDIGWNGTIQRYLQEILDREGIAIETVGLYLMTTPAVLSLNLDGVSTCGYLVEAGAPATDYRWLIRSVEILEQVCTPAVGSVIGFTDSGQPVTAPYSVGRAQARQIQAIQDGILKFQDIVMLHDDFPMDWSSDTIRRYLRNILFRGMVNPMPSETTLFAEWKHDENMSSQQTEELFSPSAATLIEYMTPRQLLEIPMKELYWPFGLVAHFSEELAGAVRVVTNFRVEPRYLEGVIGGHAKLYLDEGAGFVEEGAIVVPLTRNAKGLSYAKFQRECKTLHRLRIDPIDRPGVIRIDAIRVTGWKAEGAGYVERLITGSQLGLVGRVGGMQQLGISFYRCGSDPTVQLDVELLGIEDVCRIKVEMAVALLEFGRTVDSSVSSYVFPPYAADLDRFFSDRPVKNGIGVIDTINEIPIAQDQTGNRIAVNRGEPIRLRGWCIDKDGKRVSPTAYLKLSDISGIARYLPVRRVARSDVSRHYKASSLQMAGADIDIDSSLLEPGIYKLSYVQVFATALDISDTKVELEVVDGNSLVKLVVNNNPHENSESGLNAS